MLTFMQWLPALFAALVMVAGWYYLFYSRSVERLSTLEAQRDNQRRMRLRRIGAVAMLVLGVLFYAGFYTVDPNRPGIAFFLIWSGVTVVLLVIVILAAMDVRLTLKLRRGRSKP
jgi:Na+/H+ antiporter NhaD/arsenite permease-like protein